MKMALASTRTLWCYCHTVGWEWKALSIIARNEITSIKVFIFYLQVVCIAFECRTTLNITEHVFQCMTWWTIEFKWTECGLGVPRWDSLRLCQWMSHDFKLTGWRHLGQGFKFSQALLYQILNYLIPGQELKLEHVMAFLGDKGFSLTSISES